MEYCKTAGMPADLSIQLTKDMAQGPCKGTSQQVLS